MPPNIRLRGIRASVPGRQVIGRVAGAGPAQLLGLNDLKAMGIAGGPGAPQQLHGSLTIYGNAGAAAAVDQDLTITQVLDFLTGTAGTPASRGSVLFRGASAWALLAPGTSGYFLQTQGAGADPLWAAASGVDPVIGFCLNNGVTGTSTAPRAVAARTGHVSFGVVCVNSSDATTDLTFTIKQNGTGIWTKTVAHATAAGNLTTTTLTGAPIAVTKGDIFTIDVSSGTSSWAVTIQLEN